MTATVSVIIPVFNRAAVLGEAVESVLSQQGATVQVIIIDDCSTDDSLAVANQLAVGDPRVVVVGLSVNKGPAAARNRGLKLVTSDYLTFLDSDDLMTPGRLVSQLAEIADHPRCLVTGCQKVLVAPGVLLPELILAGIDEPNHQYIMSMFGSRSTFETIGTFDESYRVSEDLEYLVRALDMGIEVRSVESLFVIRRVLGDNLVNDSEALRSARFRIYRERHRRVNDG